MAFHHRPKERSMGARRKTGNELPNGTRGTEDVPPLAQLADVYEQYCKEEQSDDLPAEQQGDD
jgi:hypothetical protein